MAKPQFRKFSVSLPPQLVEDLDYLSSRMGVTRSALIASLMAEPTHDLREMVEMIPENPTPADVLRLRGRSESIVNQRVESLRRLSNDLFSR
jgi:hypothetical protein